MLDVKAVVSCEVQVDYANEHNVIVYAIGIGTSEGYFIEVSDAVGPLGVDDEELKNLAEVTGGKFYYPETAADLESVYTDIAASKKTKVSLDLTFFLLIFILVMLVMEWVLINTRYRIIP